MRTRKWLWAALGALLGLGLLSLLLMSFPRQTLAFERQAPAQPGVAISPGDQTLVDAGDTVIYYHTITNTGDTAGLYSVQARASEDWPLDYFNVHYPGGTTALLPFPLQAGEVATIGVRLFVPAAVRPGIVNTTTVTATVMATMGPFAHAVAYDKATVIRQIYLPLVIRNYDPFTNGDFSNGLRSWETTGILGTALAADPDQPTNTVALVGNPGYACTYVPVGYAGLTQAFVAPQAPAGASVHIQFRYRIYSNDYNYTLSDNFDSFDVRVNGALRLRDANQATFDYCNVAPYDLGWKTGDIALGAGGMPVVLSFEVHNRFDTLYNTYVYVDDVRIVVVN